MHARANDGDMLTQNPHTRRPFPSLRVSFDLSLLSRLMTKAECSGGTTVSHASAADKASAIVTFTPPAVRFLPSGPLPWCPPCLFGIARVERATQTRRRAHSTHSHSTHSRACCARTPTKTKKRFFFRLSPLQGQTGALRLKAVVVKAKTDYFVLAEVPIGASVGVGVGGCVWGLPRANGLLPARLPAGLACRRPRLTPADLSRERALFGGVFAHPLPCGLSATEAVRS